MPEKVRYHEIDILRGLGIFFIIVIHATAYYTSQGFARMIWNFSQFAVPLFVFCSTYLFFHKRNHYIRTSYFSYVWKRLYRLLQPYYVFLIFYLPVTGAVSFTKINWEELVREATLTTPGTQLNWAVLLFAYIAALMPLLLFLYRKMRPVFFLYAVLAVVSSFLLVYTLPSINYKVVMWAPWSVILLYSWFFVRYEHKSWFYPFAVFLSGGVFVLLYMILQTQGKSLLLIDNKYPPNLYFLSYGILATTVLYLLAKREVFNLPVIRKPIGFLSKNSYSIFFIHLLLIIAWVEFFDVRIFAWWQFSAVVLVSSVFVQLLMDSLLKKWVALNGAPS